MDEIKNPTVQVKFHMLFRKNCWYPIRHATMSELLETYTIIRCSFADDNVKTVETYLSRAMRRVLVSTTRPGSTMTSSVNISDAFPLNSHFFLCSFIRSSSILSRNQLSFLFPHFQIASQPRPHTSHASKEKGSGRDGRQQGHCRAACEENNQGRFYHQEICGTKGTKSTEST